MLAGKCYQNTPFYGEEQPGPLLEESSSSHLQITATALDGCARPLLQQRALTRGALG
jgi:hypothetical protein